MMLFILLTFGERSRSLSLGVIQFQIDVVLSVNFWDGSPAINNVGFRSEILNLLKRDMGCLNLRIL